jgi:hypothetical protein
VRAFFQPRVYDFVQRKAIPKFRDCSVSSTWGFSQAPNAELESARRRAADYVDVAMSILTHDPEKYRKASAYRIALDRHFQRPNDADRQKIRANYVKIRGLLNPEKIRCAATEEDLKGCDAVADKGLPAAYMSKGETFLCQPFWTMNHKCRAMVLIHEAAHAVGIGMGSPHPPYRGGNEYPFGSAAPLSAQPTSRIDNPDAYSYFAAHVWREVDAECYSFAELVTISGSKP